LLILAQYQLYWQFDLRHFTELLTLAKYCGKRARQRGAPPNVAFIASAKMYLDRKLDIRKIIFLTSYRNGNIVSTNTPANVDDRYFLVAGGTEINLPRTLESPSRSQPLNFSVRFTVQHVPESVVDRWCVLWRKYLPRLFQRFPVARRVCAWYWRVMRASTRVDAYGYRCSVHTCLIPWR